MYAQVFHMNIDVQASVGTTPLDITSLVQIVCHPSLTKWGTQSILQWIHPKKFFLSCVVAWCGAALLREKVRIYAVLYVATRKRKYEEVDVWEMTVCSSEHYCHCIV